MLLVDQEKYDVENYVNDVKYLRDEKQFLYALKRKLDDIDHIDKF